MMSVTTNHGEHKIPPKKKSIFWSCSLMNSRCAHCIFNSIIAKPVSPVEKKLNTCAKIFASSKYMYMKNSYQKNRLSNISQITMHQMKLSYERS